MYIIHVASNHNIKAVNICVCMYMYVHVYCMYIVLCALLNASASDVVVHQSDIRQG